MFEILCECDDEERGFVEQDYIQIFNSYKNGYNMTRGGEININGEKEIFVYNFKGEFLQQYVSLSECSRNLGISIQNIYQAVNNKHNRQTCRDVNGNIYRFSYIKYPFLEVLPALSRQGYLTLLINYENNMIIQEFKSLRSASVFAGVHETFARNIASGKKKRAFSKKLNC